jgi:hypothetical protein
LRSGSALEDVNDFVAIKVSTAMDLLSDYAKLEDNKENRELLISEVADNLGISSQDKEASGVIGSLPSLIKGQVNHNQVQFVVNIFTNLIIEGKREIYEKKGAINAIDAIYQKVDKAIVEQEKKATNKQDIENDKWTDRIKKQRLSMESHEHLH